jgi:hypothetical protein
LQIFVAIDLAARIALSENIELGGVLSAKCPSTVEPRASHEPDGTRNHDDDDYDGLDHDWHPAPREANCAWLRHVPRLSDQNNATVDRAGSHPRLMIQVTVTMSTCDSNQCPGAAP